MKIKNFKLTNKGLYWGLIITFTILYIFIGLVSTIHAISFFQLANSVTLAVFLAFAFELGQSSVLFALLTTKNKDRFLPWVLMFLLTGVQITGNVFASFRHIATSGSDDWIFWQKTILFGVQAPNPEMYQVIIAYIQGALLPLIGLGLVSLVVQNFKHFSSDDSLTESPLVDNLENKFQKESKLISTLDSDDEFGPVDLTNVFPDKLIDIDKSRIGGKLIPKQENQINDYITQNKQSLDYLDEEVANLIPENSQTTPVNNVKITKKRGRPLKTKEDMIEPKKQKKLLLTDENVSVPQKSKRFVNPLKKKDKKIKPIKKLEELIKPSKGEEVIKLIQNINKNKTEEPTLIENKSEETPLDESQTPLEQTYIDEYGVSVIDGKAIPKESEKIKKNN